MVARRKWKYSSWIPGPHARAPVLPLLGGQSRSECAEHGLNLDNLAGPGVRESQSWGLLGWDVRSF